MKSKRHLLLLIFMFMTACAWYSTSIKKGEMLFIDPTLGNGTSGKTCNTCHENGEGISADFDKKMQYTLMGLELQSLPDLINNCIEITLRGEEIDPHGEEMQALINYLQYLQSKKSLTKD